MLRWNEAYVPQAHRALVRLASTALRIALD